MKFRLAECHCGWGQLPLLDWSGHRTGHIPPAKLHLLPHAMLLATQAWTESRSSHGRETGSIPSTMASSIGNIAGGIWLNTPALQPAWTCKQNNPNGHHRQWHGGSREQCCWADVGDQPVQWWYKQQWLQWWRERNNALQLLSNCGSANLHIFWKAENKMISFSRTICTSR